MTPETFFELIPTDPSRARTLLILWFSDLRFMHNEETHALILASLGWPETHAVFFVAAIEEGGIGDFETFAEGIKRHAQLARERGLVRPVGEKRRAGAGRPRKDMEACHG